MDAYSPIPQVIVADDGTITLPASVAEQAGWPAGMALDLIAGAVAVSVRKPAPRRGTRTADEVFASLAKLRDENPYRGPPVTDDEMHTICQEMAWERYQRSLPAR